MKIRKRVLSSIVAACMLVTVFSFAPGVYAETTPPDGVTPDTVESETSINEEPENDPTEASTEEEVPKTYKIIAGVTQNGRTTVSPSGSGIKAGTTITYTVTPNKGYKTTSIRQGSEAANVTVPYGTTTGTFKAEGDTTVTANFAALANYKVSTSVNSTSRGSITQSAAVKENSAITIKSVPKSGYFLSDLQVNGKSVGAKATYTISNVKANYTVKAVFSKRIKIMLDAGHYGKYNRSPVYSSYYESNMTWALQNYLKAELQKYPGFYIGLTRSSQSRDMDVYYRGKAAAGYDLFLSLHSNSSSSRTTDYPLIITQKGGTGDKLAKELGKSIEDTMNTKQNYKVWQKLSSSGAEYYGVLRGSKSAGVKGMIVEHSFHSNLTATKWLYSNTNLKKMAIEEAEVLADYYGVTKEGVAGNSSTPPSSNAGSSSDHKPVSQVVSSSEKVKVLVSSLNMRQSYSTSSRSMGKAKKGTTYQLKAKTKDGNWGQLKTNSYWIYLKGYTTPVKASSSNGSSSSSSSSSSKTVASSQKVKVTVSSLNIRRSYSTSSQKMGTARKNYVYQLKAKTRDGKWGQLRTNGYWIYLKGYTKAVSSSTSSSSSSTSSTSKVVKSSQKVKITVSSLNMRRSYSTGSRSMGKVKKNKTYQLKAKTRDGKWGQLSVNGYWIYLRGYTRAVSSSTSSSSSASKVVKSSQKVKVTVSSLNMRRSYSTGSSSRGKAKKNRIYQLKAKTRDGKWGQLSINSYWIYLRGYTRAV